MKIILEKEKKPIKNCIHFKDRLVGALLEKTLERGYFFPKCQSVHTFFMRQKIDIVFVDMEYTILSILTSCPPNRVFRYPKAYGVFEFKDGTCQNWKAGQQLIIEK